MDILILLATFLVMYLFLRVQGGEGLSIKIKLPPASTPEGKRARVLNALMAILSFVILFTLAFKNNGEQADILLPAALLGALVVLIPLTLKKK